jgi:hypothetical protein
MNKIWSLTTLYKNRVGNGISPSFNSSALMSRIQIVNGELMNSKNTVIKRGLKSSRRGGGGKKRKAIFTKQQQQQQQAIQSGSFRPKDQIHIPDKKLTIQQQQLKEHNHLKQKPNENPFSNVWNAFVILGLFPVVATGTLVYFNDEMREDFMKKFGIQEESKDTHK